MTAFSACSYVCRPNSFSAMAWLGLAFQQVRDFNSPAIASSNIRERCLLLGGEGERQVLFVACLHVRLQRKGSFPFDGILPIYTRVGHDENLVSSLGLFSTP